MGLVKSLFAPSPDALSRYGSILEEIEKQIKTIKQRRSTRRRRHAELVRGLLTMSTILGGIMLAWMYLYNPGNAMPKKLLRVSPLVFFPLFCFFAKKLLDWYFLGGIEADDAQLEVLEQQKGLRLAELKERMRYDDLHRVISQFSKREDEAKAAEEGRGEEATAPSGTLLSPSASLASPRPGGDPAQLSSDDARAFEQADVIAAPTGQRGVMDKLVDYVLGDGPNNRFALICRRCFMHNGLVREEDLDLRYRCSGCGALNGPASSPSPSTKETAGQREEKEPASASNTDLSSGQESRQTVLPSVSAAAPTPSSASALAPGTGAGIDLSSDALASAAALGPALGGARETDRLIRRSPRPKQLSTDR